MTTHLHYNGVTLRDCQTLTFEQDMRYDDSDTDLMFFRFRIRVASTLQTYDINHHPSTIDTYLGDTVVAREEDLQKRLSEPRKDFWYYFEGCPTNVNNTSVVNQSLLISCGETTGNITSLPGIGGSIPRHQVADVNNGPKPRVISVKQIFGSRAMRVEFEIEVSVRKCLSSFIDYFPPECDSGCSDDYPGVSDQNMVADGRVLSNRWSLSESKDDEWRTTKVIEGTLRVSNSQYWAHLMRYLCIPSLLDGYRRVRQDFVSDPTNLVLKYRIEDRQETAAAPWPIVKWNGTHSEASSNNGAIQIGSVHLRVTGPIGVDKRWLIGRAGAMMVSRLNGIARVTGGTGDDYGTTLKEFAVIDQLDQPTIEMRAHVKYHSADAKYLALRINNMGLPLNSGITIDGYDPQSHPVPLAYDSESPAGLFACYLQSPCSIWHDMPEGLSPGEESFTQRSRTKETESQSWQYPEENPITMTPETMRPYYSDTSVYQYPYTMYEMQGRYETDNGFVQLPYAEPQASGSDPTCAVVRMHDSVCRRILTVRAVRTGSMPKVPVLTQQLTDQNGITETLLEYDLDISTPQKEADRASNSYAIQLVAYYALSRPPVGAELLRAGTLPFAEESAAVNSVAMSAVQDSYLQA